MYKHLEYKVLYYHFYQNTIISNRLCLALLSNFIVLFMFLSSKILFSLSISNNLFFHALRILEVVVVYKRGEFQITQRKHKARKFQRQTHQRSPPKIMFTLHFSSFTCIFNYVSYKSSCIKNIAFNSLTPLLSLTCDVE